MYYDKVHFIHQPCDLRSSKRSALGLGLVLRIGYGVGVDSLMGLFLQFWYFLFSKN